MRHIMNAAYMQHSGSSGRAARFMYILAFVCLCSMREYINIYVTCDMPPVVWLLHGMYMYSYELQASYMKTGCTCEL